MMMERRASRLPVPALLAVLTVGIVLVSRQARLGHYLGRAWAQGLWGAVPPFWEMSAALLVKHLIHLAQAGWLTLLFFGTGRAAADRLKVRGSDPWEDAALSFALGTGLWSYLFLALGLARLLYGPLLWALLLSGTAWAAWALRGFRSAPRPPRGVAGPDWGERAWAALLAVQLLLLLPYALVPETFYDSLEYHLGLPNLYLLRHGIGPIPDNSFAGVPSVPSMLFGWALAVDPDGIAAHLLSFSFLPWTLVGIAGLTRRLGLPRAGLPAAALFAMLPVVGTVAIMTTVELPWGFYQLLCFPAVLTAIEKGVEDPARPRWLVAAGILLGLAASCKYLAWPLPFAFALLYAALRFDEVPLRRRLADLAWIGGTAALVLLPWIVKNVLFYRNPVFPFLHEFWDPGSEVMPGWRYLGSGATFAYGGLWSGLRQIFLSPWNMVHYMAKPADSIGSGFLPFLLLPFFVRLRSRERLLAFFAFGAWLPLGLVVHLPRYFIPLLSGLCVLTAVAIERIEAAWVKRVVTGAALAASAAMGLAGWRWNYPTTRWDAFLGRESFADMLRNADKHYYPAPLYPAVEFINEKTPADSRVLVFGDSRGFGLRRDHEMSTPRQATVLERWANAASSGRELKARMDRAGITHIIVNHADIVRQGAEFRFSPRGKASLDEFWARYTLKVFQAGPDDYIWEDGRRSLNRWVVVYQVLDERASALEHQRDDLFSAYSVEF